MKLVRVFGAKVGSSYNTVMVSVKGRSTMDNGHRTESFSQEARRVLNASEREANEMEHPSITPLHLLLGMLQVTNSHACRILQPMGLEYRHVLPVVQELSPTMVRAVRREVELSDELRKVIEFAIDESRINGASCIVSEHLLLGLIRRPDYAIVSILQRVSLDPESVRRATRQFMLQLDDQPAAEAQVKPAGLSEQMKILQMVEAGKISAAEAGELLRALQLTSTPAVAYTNKPIGEVNQIRSRHVRLTISDKNTRQPKADYRLPVDRLQAEIFVLIQLLYNGYTGKFAEYNGANDRVEIAIE